MGRHFFLQDGGACIDCVGSWSPEWTVDEFTGWVQNTYTFESVQHPAAPASANGSIVAQRSAYLVTQLTPE